MFAWLAQMGFGRAGWYSYDWIDNLGRPSARHLEPAWAVTGVDQAMPGGPVDFTVHRFEAPHELVLGLLDQRLGPWTISFTLAYVLQPTPGGTRLLVRARTAIDGRGGAPVGTVPARLLLLGDGVMVRRQLLGLQERCRPG